MTTTHILLGIIIVLLVILIKAQHKRHLKISSKHSQKAVQYDQEIEIKILAFIQEHGRIKNDDVQKLFGVSDATATRYLQSLEDKGRITQKGVVGEAVFYV